MKPTKKSSQKGSLKSTSSKLKSSGKKLVKKSLSKKPGTKLDQGKIKDRDSNSIQNKIKVLYKKNKELQSEINKAKKKYESLERESVLLTKELMEAGYIPKDLTSGIQNQN